MFSVLELIKSFGVSKGTIYSKLKSEEMKDYIIQTDDGMRMKPEGMPLLSTLLADSRAKYYIKNTESEQESIPNPNDNYLNDYISELKSKIEFLQGQLDKSYTEKMELQQKYDNVFSLIIEQQKQQLLLQQPKKSWFWQK